MYCWGFWEMRSYSLDYLWMALNVIASIWVRGTQRRTDTQKGGHFTTEAETGDTAVTILDGQRCSELEEAGMESPEKPKASASPLIWDSGLVREYFQVVLLKAACGNLLQQPHGSNNKVMFLKGHGGWWNLGHFLGCSPEPTPDCVFLASSGSASPKCSVWEILYPRGFRAS